MAVSSTNTTIQLLDGLDHIRTKPGMWIGHNMHPTHLLKEVLDNAIDEVVNGYGNTITLDYDKDKGTAIVADNGRGFPIEMIDLPDKEGQIDSVVAAVCRVFSGSKFNSNTSNYQFSVGTHGVGLTAVNALSKFLSFTIKVRNKPNTYAYYEFRDGIHVKTETKTLSKSLGFSTCVEFHADEKYFESVKFDVSIILPVLELLASTPNKPNVVVNGVKLEHTSLEKFVRRKFGLSSESPLYHLHHDEPNGESVEVYFTYLESGGTERRSDINFGWMRAGTHYDAFERLLSKVIRSNFNVTPTKQDTVNGLRYFMSLRVKDPSFSSQDKRAFSKRVDYLINPLEKQLVTKFKGSYLKEFIANRITNKHLKAIKKVLKRKGNRVSTDNPLKDCRDRTNNVLYILEGESAEGTLKAIRDSNREAILAINGKIINTKNLTITDLPKLLGNKKSKFKYLLEAIGIDFDKKEKQKYRYDLIRVICDADPDGLHISVLVSIAIWKFAPDLIESGRFRIILPPLYGANAKGKKFVPIYDSETLDYYRNKGYAITRYKGLGEMDPSELEVVLSNPIEYTPRIPTTEREISNVNRLLNDSELKRHICEMPEFSLKYVIDRVAKTQNPKQEKSK